MLEIADLTTPLIGPISLGVKAGECVAVLGPSGAGKSLFLRAIADLDPNEGAVRIGEERRESLSAPAWRRRAALVPAESGWWGDTVGEHFAGGGDPAPLLEALGLPAAALSWSVARLSSGERQRLALIRALLGAPKALLLDEPTAALDGAATARVEALLTERLRDGLALLLVTHDEAQAERLAARRFRLEAGRLRPAEARAAAPSASGPP